MSIRLVFISICGVVILWAPVMLLAETPYKVTLYQQLGSQPNVSMAINTAGNLFVTGATWDSLDGSQQGLGDAFLRKYNAAGTLLWTKQLGTSDYDESLSVSVDASGNAFITGHTRGSLGGTNQGDYDVFLSKYNTSGSLLWTQQLGSSSYDYSYSVAVDSSGNALITGETGGSLGGTHQGGYWDAFLLKYDSSGALLWKNQLGTTGSDGSQAVTVDAAGSAFITGFAGGPLSTPQYGGFDAFLAKYSDNGTLLWATLLGTDAADDGFSTATDTRGNIFIAGRSVESRVAPHTGSSDAFLSKCDANGKLLWTRSLGEAANCDEGLRVAVDASGNVYMSGYTDGSLGGPNLGGGDVFLNKYDTEGTLLWSEQLGTDVNDVCTSLLIDTSGNVFLGGTASGWSSESSYKRGSFIYKLSPIPEPTGIALFFIAITCLLSYAWQRRSRLA